jgi:hypothetical protein
MKLKITVIIIANIFSLLVVAAIVYMTIKDNDATVIPSPLSTENSTPASDI